jgi:hypothetical protein
MPEWTPADDETINKSKSIDGYTDNHAKARVRRPNYDMQDMRKFDIRLKWWNFDWTVTKAAEREPTDKEKLELQNFERLQLPGQTVVHTVSAGQPSNDLGACLLGFHSSKAYLTWLDTEGKCFVCSLVIGCCTLICVHSLDAKQRIIASWAALCC